MKPLTRCSATPATRTSTIFRILHQGRVSPAHRVPEFERTRTVHMSVGHFPR
jgi:hypothetical protein